MIWIHDPDGTQYFCAQTMEDCEKVLRMIRDADTLVYDAETSGLDWRYNHVVGHVFTDVRHNESFYVPVRHAGGGNVPGCRVPDTDTGWDKQPHPFEVEFKRVARERHRRWVGQNFAFDLRFLHALNIDLYGVYEDTMINAPLIDENMASFSLESLAKYFGVKEKDAGIYEYLASLFGGEPNRAQMSNWWRTPGNSQPVIRYAAGDGITTAKVWAEQQKDIAEQALDRVHNVECRLIRTLHRMTTRGIRIDQDELVRVHDLFKGRADELTRGLPSWFTNIRAPSQIRRYLEDEIDEDWPRNPITAAQIKKAEKEGTTPMGSLKFDEDALSRSEKGRELIQIKKMLHALSSFVEPMMQRHMFNGRVHCEFNQLRGDEYGTISGRLSSSNPNMQQIPKRNKAVSKPYRKVFLPEDGHVWYDNDYSQQEYVVFTNYTKDPNLVKGYLSDPPVDIHSVVSMMLDVERDPTAKRMNLGMLYGMGRPALAGHLGVSIEQATEWQALYHSRFPYAKKFLKSANERALRRGYVHTFLGRRRRFPDRRFAHKAGNAVIQGSSADVTKLKMVEIDEYFESEGDIFNLMLQCHDSLSWSGPESHGYQNVEAKRIMTSFGPDDMIHLEVPIRIDSGEGPNWSVATFGE